MIHEWSANKLFYVDELTKVLSKEIRRKIFIAFSSQVRNHIHGKSPDSLRKTIEQEKLPRFDSVLELKERTFYHSLSASHWWSLVIEICCCLLPFFWQNFFFWQAWEKGNMRSLRIGQFLKKTQMISIFYCSSHKKIFDQLKHTKKGTLKSGSIVGNFGDIMEH